MKRQFKIGAGESGQRFDVVLATAVKLSRTAAQKAIREGRATVDGQSEPPRRLLKVGETISWQPIIVAKPPKAVAKLPIVYEDDDLLVIDKPAGLVVHPVAGAPSRLSVAALVAGHLRNLKGERAGIVHRLDKDTSGLLIIAKTLNAQVYMQDLFKRRLVKKTYTALVKGRLKPAQASIELPLARDRRFPVKRSVAAGGKAAVTKYRVTAEWPGYSLVEAYPQTGRSHQLRVHFSYLGHPIVGDERYGTGQPGLSRHFLHATGLAFTGPSGQSLQLESPLPPELRGFLSRLQNQV